MWLKISIITQERFSNLSLLNNENNLTKFQLKTKDNIINKFTTEDRIIALIK